MWLSNGCKKPISKDLARRLLGMMEVRSALLLQNYSEHGAQKPTPGRLLIMIQVGRTWCDIRG